MGSVGASGGIAGLMAYYLIRFPKRRFVFRYFLFRLIALAHLGGAFVGAVFAIYYSPKRGLDQTE